MSATATSVTRRELASEIERLEAWPQALERRVKGVAWMVWGVILAGAFFTYDYLGLAHETYGGAMWPFLVVWIPWALFGSVATWALWKANGLHGRTAAVARRMALVFLVFGLLVFLFFVAYHYSGVWRNSPLVGPSVMLTMMGLAAIVFGVTGFGSSDRTDRLLWIVGGFALMLVVILGTAVVGPDQHAALRWFGWVGPLATGLVYFGNGLYLSLRG